jgi:hypothetical protein
MDGNLEIHVNGLRFRPDGPSSRIGELRSFPDGTQLIS